MDDLEMIADAEKSGYPEWFVRAWVEGGTDLAVLKMFGFLAQHILDLREESKIGTSDTPHVPYLDAD